MKEVEELLTAQGPQKDQGPAVRLQAKAHKRKAKDITNAAVALNVQRFKERCKGCSVADVLASIPLRISKGSWGNHA